MKVKELIELLQKEDPEALIVQYNGHIKCLQEVVSAYPLPVRKDTVAEDHPRKVLLEKNLRQASPKDKGALPAIKLSTY